MQKINFNFAALTEVLSGLQVVIDDSMNETSLRNFIFKIVDGELEILGTNPRMSYGIKLDKADYSVESDEGNDFTFQIKSQELSNFLGAFKQLHRTQVSGVEFNIYADRGVKRATVTVREVNINDENDVHNARWTFTCTGIIAAVENQNVFDEPEEYSEVFVEELKKYISAFSPIVVPAEGQSGSVYSQIFFDGDTVAVQSSAFLAVIKNKLNGVFGDFQLVHRGMVFLKYLLSKAENLEVGENNGAVYFRGENFKAKIIKGNFTGFQYRDFLRDVSESGNVTVDRVYFKDVLRRLNLENDDIKITFKEDGLFVENSKFNQALSYLKKPENWTETELKFVISPRNLALMILSVEEDFGEELKIYVTPSKTRIVLTLTNEEQSFRTLASVRPIK